MSNTNKTTAMQSQSPLNLGKKLTMKSLKRDIFDVAIGLQEENRAIKKVVTKQALSIASMEKSLEELMASVSDPKPAQEPSKEPFKGVELSIYELDYKLPYDDPEDSGSLEERILGLYRHLESSPIPRALLSPEALKEKLGKTFQKQSKGGFKGSDKVFLTPCVSNPGLKDKSLLTAWCLLKFHSNKG